LQNIQEINDHVLFDEISGNAKADYSILTNIYFNEFELNLCNYTYDSNNGYTVIPYNNKISFIFTRIEDITKMLNSFLNINSYEVNKNKNPLNTNDIIFNKTFKDIIYEDEKIMLDFYNTY
jgi:hypothetical protein